MLWELLPNLFNIRLPFFVIVPSLIFHKDRVIGWFHQFLYDILTYEFRGTLISQLDGAKIYIEWLLVFDVFFILPKRSIILDRLDRHYFHFLIYQIFQIFYILFILFYDQFICICQLYSFPLGNPLFAIYPFNIYLMFMQLLSFSQIFLFFMQEFGQMGSTLALQDFILIGLKERFFCIHLFCDIVWPLQKSTAQTFVSLGITKTSFIFGKWAIMDFIHGSRPIFLTVDYILHDFDLFLLMIRMLIPQLLTCSGVKLETKCSFPYLRLYGPIRAHCRLVFSAKVNV